MSLRDRLREARDGEPARVHIDAEGEIVIDLRTEDEPPLATTDIHCPNCGGSLRVDDLDRTVLAAQLSCIDCGFTFVQRLHRGGWAEGSARRMAWSTGEAGNTIDPRPLPHRRPRAHHPVDHRSRAERARTVQAGADYFWTG